MNTEEGNKLIAIFDGYRVIENHPEYGWACTAHPTIDLAAIADHQLKYHSSWDWLHGAWDKFSKMELQGDGFDGTYNKHLQAISTAIIHLSIQTAFERLARGIHWHNSIQPSATSTNVK